METSVAESSLPERSFRLQFSHQQLEDPIEQIRLLEIKPLRQGNPLEVCLRIYSWANVPPYQAISYTWGDHEDPKIVLIDDRPMAVTKNCHYALTQVHLHQSRLSGEATAGDPSKHLYLWIDSICIDQSDANEKGHQVAMMGRIYANASKVLACVGPHQDDSSELADCVDLLKSPRGDPLSYKYCLDHFGDRISYFLPRKTVWDLREFFKLYLRKTSKPWNRGQVLLQKAFIAFGNRSYWTRVWIMQEVAASYGAGDRLEVFCGHNFFTRSDIYFLFHLMYALSLGRVLGELHEESWIHGTPMTFGDIHAQSYRTDEGEMQMDHKSCFTTVMDLDPAEPIPAQILIVQIDRSHKCSKPEDRVYGLLSLIKWPNSIQSIEPVYSPSAAFDLAELFVSFRRQSAFTHRVLKGLEIYHDNLQMEELVAVRSGRSATKDDRCSKLIPQDYKFENMHFRILSRNSVNQLTANIEYSEDPSVKPDGAINEGTWSSQQYATTRNTPQALFCDSGVCALLCTGAREHDVIITTGFGQGLLVIRSNDENGQYDIIGQGLLFAEYDITRTSRLKSIKELHEEVNRDTESVRMRDVNLGTFAVMLKTGMFGKKSAMIPVSKANTMATIHLHVKPVEILLLAGQDLEKGGIRNAGASIRRLNTKIYGTVQYLH